MTRSGVLGEHSFDPSDPILDVGQAVDGWHHMGWGWFWIIDMGVWLVLLGLVAYLLVVPPTQVVND